jgi:hypothetical protein
MSDPNAIGITDTVHQFTPSSASQPDPQTQSGTAYSVFNNLPLGSYTINSQAPPQYVFARACWSDTLSGTSGEGKTQTLESGDTITWDLAYTLGVAWSQAQGGDVNASGMLQSYVPVPHPPTQTPPPTNVFILDGAGGSPGVATYGTDYTFDSSGLTKGQTWVSSKNWLVHDTATSPDYYQLLYQQFGSPAPTGSGDTTLSSPSDVSGDVYYYDGNVTVGGSAWSIPADAKTVVFVSGNLAINTPITITPGGFIAFIVGGNITVATTVGALDGIYITSPSGTFDTGTGDARFIGTGSFIAGNFILQRDLGDAGNPTTSSELFIYNPQLLLSMPDQMKNLSVTWQEAAP